jgi:hypothetical protein
VERLGRLGSRPEEVEALCTSQHVSLCVILFQLLGHIVGLIEHLPFSETPKDSQPASCRPHFVGSCTAPLSVLLTLFAMSTIPSLTFIAQRGWVDLPGRGSHVGEFEL